MMRKLILIICLIVWGPGTISAHEVRPGYLELKETAPNMFSVLWKVPMRGDMQLRIAPRLPDTCQEKNPASFHRAPGAVIQRWSVTCVEGLAGHRLLIEGLEHTITDVLVRIELLHGETQTQRLTPAGTSFVVSASPSTANVIHTYLWLGIEHILFGVDHLLFVLALLIIVTGWRRLVGAITAFTAAHSITLASATLGYVQVPQQPVEAVIALSILFLASEIIHGHQGRPGLAARWPWVVAFVFGLLHGFGFAGALAEVGLPEQAIPLALLCFNVGVEVGQLAFVTGTLLLGWAARNFDVVRWRQAEMVATYGIGSMAAFWMVERVLRFWG